MTKIKITKPDFRWLFGGIGFHNSEATMMPLMSEKFKNQFVLKSFREISPTFSRIFAGYANWTKEAMDSFADYYDLTFRNSKTLLYLVPGRMPLITEDFDMEKYCEAVACNLEYLIVTRKCTKIRYYCVTNELSMGNTYAYFADNLELFKKLHKCLYRAFKRHNLDIGLLATDCSGVENFGQIEWATQNMDEVTEVYCAHLYSSSHTPGSPDAYKYFMDSFTPPVHQAHAKEKRFILGEFGIIEADRSASMPMRNDVCYSESNPDKENITAIALCEMAVAVINSGSFAGVLWSMYDYPDPFIRENGDSPEEKARYNVARFSGHGLDIRYNKNGLIRWCDDEQNYSSRASLYTMGYMAKLFKKGSRVLNIENCDDKNIRCAAVTNPDLSASIVIINWEDKKKDITVELEHNANKPFRKIEYCADNVPYNKFNDLQNYSEEINLTEQKLNLSVMPKSVTFLTTDYISDTPSEIKNISVSQDKLTWRKCTDANHCYYRVFASEKSDFIPSAENQIASTVSEYIPIDNKKLYYKVLSVDTSGNTRN